MSIRTGEQYIEGLRTRPREVWVHGNRVDDITAHPSFRRPMQQIAHLYDMQHDAVHQDVLSYAPACSKGLAGTSYLIPRTYDDLVKRRNAFRLWAEATFGLMG